MVAQAFQVGITNAVEHRGPADAHVDHGGGLRRTVFEKAAEFAIERLHSSAVALLPKEVDEVAGKHLVPIRDTSNDEATAGEEKEKRLRAGLILLRSDLQRLLADLWK